MAGSPSPPLGSDRPRILLVEDEYLIAAMVCDMLVDLGCEYIGPIANMEQGIAAAKSVACEAAIINLVIEGRHAYEIVEALAARNIPFCFASGLPQKEIIEKWRDRPFIMKPYVLDDVRAFLVKIALLYAD